MVGPGTRITVNQRTCVEAGCYDGVKVTEKSSEDEPGAFQHKYYAPGAGGVRVGWAGDDPTKETGSPRVDSVPRMLS
ncbi:MAG TPA: hypothetical protein VH915_06760, partial [Pedococcus sp.]